MITPLISALVALAACTDASSPDARRAGAPVDLAVTSHPDVATVLVATWTQPEATNASWVAFTFGDTDLRTPVIARPAGPAHEVLLGIPAGTEVAVQVYNQGQETVSSAVVTAATGSLPLDLVSPTVSTWDPTRASPERWMLVTADAGDHAYQGPFYALILDREGRVVWYWPVPDAATALYAQPGWDGTHLLVDADATYTFAAGVRSSVFRLTLDLARLDEISIPDLQFAVDEETDGAVLYTRENGQRGWSLTRHDAQGADTDLWSCSDFIPAFGLPDTVCLANTIVWDADRDTVLYSMPQIDAVVEVDSRSGEPRMVFGGLSGGWAISPSTSEPDYQHYANWTSDGTILLSTHVPDEARQMRAREFAVDDATQTLTEVWSYGEGGAHYATGSGEAVRLANGDTLIGYGTDGAVVEVSPEGDLLWDLEWPTSRAAGSVLIGHATLIDDLYALNGEPAP